MRKIKQFITINKNTKKNPIKIQKKEKFLEKKIHVKNFTVKNN